MPGRPAAGRPAGQRAGRRARTWPHGAVPVLGLHAVERDLLLTTLAAWLECDGSARRAAVQLYCHRNTVVNRLRRLEQLAQRSLARPRDLVELTLALDALQLGRPDCARTLR